MPAGRPSSYSKETALAFCEMVAEGRTVTDICSEETMPARSTIFKWLANHKEFADQYARAKEIQAERMADEILEIADDGTNDWMERQNGDGEPHQVLNGEHIQRSRLRVDARKWLMSKMMPKKYGDKLDLEHSGSVRVEKIEVEIVDPEAP